MSNERKDFLADTMVENALAMASLYHMDQTRKYTGEPYIEHPKLVQKIIHDYMMACDDIPLFAFDPLDYATMESAALLHDVVEDTNATYEKIQDVFGKKVCDLVYCLTDESKPEDDRKFRKQMYIEKLLISPYEAKCLKIADVLANFRNLADIAIKYDEKFATMYLDEKEELLVAFKTLKENKKSDKRYYWYKIFSNMLKDFEIELNEIRNRIKQECKNAR